MEAGLRQKRQAVVSSANVDEGLPIAYEVLEKGIPVLASDGVHASFADDLPGGESPDRTASLVLMRHRKPSDDAMVVVVRLRRES